MPETWRYRGQTIGGEQVVFLREFIAAHPDSSRWKLSRQLCEALGWKQANGALRDVVCRGLLLLLERGRRDRVARGAPAYPRPMPDGALTAGAVADRHGSPGHAAECAGQDRDSTPAAYCPRAAV